MAKESIFEEAKRVRNDFPSLTWNELVSNVSLARKVNKQIESDKSVSNKKTKSNHVDSLTCPSCGHEVFKLDTEIKAVSAGEASFYYWSCGKCGHTNVIQ